MQAERPSKNSPAVNSTQPAKGLSPLPEEPAPAWQVFWKPFRSEISAKGFAARTRELTGLDIEVQKQGPGAYVLAFAYRDEAERQDKAALIEQEIRMEIP